MPDNKREKTLDFDPETLVKTVIAMPLLAQIEADESQLHSVIIDVNIQHAEGRDAARSKIFTLIDEAIHLVADRIEQRPNKAKSEGSQQYVYAKLQGKVIRRVVELDKSRAIYHVWPDFIIKAQIWKSVPTVKADAGRRAFAATGKGIIWAVLDSGIDPTHAHFDKHSNLRDLPAPLKHMDFTQDPPVVVQDPIDDYGHGTHVAGIIAGELESTATQKPIAIVRERNEKGQVIYRREDTVGTVFGVAPECKLVSYKVIDSQGEGPVSNVIAAIEKIQEINGFGRQMIIHGVNLSLGYDFEPEWFACGQSPVCVEVDRLVRSGVIVVVAAGNTGKGFALTINDPGNATLAITVGSTHRDMPHTYGVSYFSSKGPTGDGRLKPDLVAPGEKIVCCGAGPELDNFKKKAGIIGQPGAYYIERSGTSMAAPHVSGIVAGLLSVRREFIGQPEEIKRMILASATDLHREPMFQGRGLVDMMRAIQTI